MVINPNAYQNYTATLLSGALPMRSGQGSAADSSATSATGAVGTVSAVPRLPAVSPVAAVGETAPSSPVSPADISAAVVVEISPERSRADRLSVAATQVQENYKTLATAEATQKEVVSKVADIRAAVRQAASTSDLSTREELRKQVSAKLAEIEQAASSVQSDTGAATANPGDSGAEDAQAAIANRINQQRMAAEAAVYLITSDAGSRTIRVVAKIAGENSLTQANSQISGTGMQVRSLGGQVYFVPSFRDSSLFKQDLNAATDAATQAFSQSGISGRITINGRPYNLFGLTGLSPQQMADLAGVAAENGGNLKEAVQNVSDGKNAADVAQEKTQKTLENIASAAVDPAPEVSAAGQDGTNPSASTAAAPEDLGSLVQPGSGADLVQNPDAALALTDRVLTNLQESGSRLTDFMNRYAEESSSRLQQMLTGISGGSSAITDGQTADRTAQQVAQQLLEARDLAAVGAGGSPAAQQYLTILQ